jgi:hypothetical protein
MNWDENIIYIQYSSSIAVHTSTSKSPFETYFGHLSPFPLDVVYGHQGVREDITREALKDDKYVEKIMKIHLQVQYAKEVKRKEQSPI